MTIADPTGADAAAPAEISLLPIVPYIGRDADGAPALTGSRCAACAELLLGAPSTCPRCGARGGMTPVILGTTGRLYNFTTVYRSLPGVPVPFIFAIVDLDGGGTVKGNLLVEPDEAAFDMPVRLLFERAPVPDAKGRSYLTYHFVKA